MGQKFHGGHAEYASVKVCGPPWRGAVCAAYCVATATVKKKLELY